MKHSSRAPYYVILTLLLVAGVGLRLWQLPSRGLHTHDEGRFLIVADSYLDAAGAVLGGGDMTVLGESLRRRGGSFFAHAKEGHIFLLAAWRSVLGRSVAASALLSVLFSLGAALMLYRLMSDWLHHPGPAVIAAAMLLLSPLFIHYSRSTLSEANSQFFLLAAFVMARRAWVKIADKRPFSKVRKPALQAGILAGLTFSCHYNKLWAMALFVLLWIVIAAQSRRELRPNHWKTLGMMLAGFLVPILFIQMITVAVAWKAGAAYPEYKTYFGDLWYHFTTFHAQPVAGAGEEQGRGGVNPLYGMALLVEWRGYAGAAVMLATLAAGCVMARRRDMGFLRAVLVMLIPPFVFFSLYRFQVERSFVGIEAAWAALVGVVWWKAALKPFRIIEKSRYHSRARISQTRPALAVACLCAVIFVITVPFAVRVVRSDASTFRQAARELAPLLVERGGRVTSGSVSWHVKPQWIVYLNREVEARLPEGARLADYVDWSVEEMGDYVLIEDFEYADSPIFPSELTAGHEPVVAIPASRLSPMIFTPGVKVFKLF